MDAEANRKQAGPETGVGQRSPVLGHPGASESSETGKKGRKAALVRKTNGKGKPHRFVKGQPGGPGRPKGSKNTVPMEVAKAILESYDHRGGVKWLNRLEDKFFVELFKPLVPKTLDMTVKGAEQFVNLRGLSDAELERIAQAAKGASDE